MGFYGHGQSNVSRSQFVFDKIYPNRVSMDNGVLTDGVYPGRYVLIEYGNVNTDEYSKNQTTDYNVYGKQDGASSIEAWRDYDSTVWQKTVVNVKTDNGDSYSYIEKYVMVAELEPDTPEFVAGNFKYNEEGVTSLEIKQIQDNPNPVDGISLDDGKNFYIKQISPENSQDVKFELHLDLPEIGNAFADIWDIIYGAPNDDSNTRRFYNQGEVDRSKEAGTIQGNIIRFNRWFNNTNNDWDNWFNDTQISWGTWFDQTKNKWDTWFSNKSNEWTEFSSDAQTNWNDWYQSVTEDKWPNALQSMKNEWSDWFNEPGNDEAVVNKWGTWFNNTQSSWDTWFNQSQVDWSAWLTNNNSTVKTDWNTWLNSVANEWDSQKATVNNWISSGGDGYNLVVETATNTATVAIGTWLDTSEGPQEEVAKWLETNGPSLFENYSDGINIPENDTLTSEATFDENQNIIGVTIEHKNKVAAGTYGGIVENTIIIPQITIDANGHVTEVKQIAIDFSIIQGTLEDLSPTEEWESAELGTGRIGYLILE